MDRISVIMSIAQARVLCNAELLQFCLERKKYLHFILSIQQQQKKKKRHLNAEIEGCKIS